MTSLMRRPPHASRQTCQRSKLRKTNELSERSENKAQRKIIATRGSQTTRRILLSLTNFAGRLKRPVDSTSRLQEFNS